jgi:hypothetical protein
MDDIDNVDKALRAVRRIDDSPDLVDLLISIEDYLDRNDIYAFKNWINGELIDGPIVKPFWISVTFKWPHKQMPDPMGGVRLLPHGTKIKFNLEDENVPVKVKTPADYQPGTHKPKIKTEKVWIVEMMIPRRFIEDIDQEVMNLYDDKVEDSDIVQDATTEGNTEENVTAGSNDEI